MSIMLLSPFGDKVTRRMSRAQLASVTQRRWRMPPVLAALLLKTASALAAHWGISGAMLANRSGLSDERAYTACTRLPETPSP